jgi:hypothetical protein
MKLLPHILIILLLCCTWGCAPEKMSTLEGTVANVDYLVQPSGVPNVMVVKFEDGRVFNQPGWLNGITIGKYHRFTINSYGYWVSFTVE